MAACGGCGATLSPAEPYCRACGTTVHRGPMLELERVDQSRQVHVSPVVPPPIPAPTAPAPPPGRGRRPGWPAIIVVLVVVALVAVTLTVMRGGGGRARGGVALPPSTTADSTESPEPAAPATDPRVGTAVDRAATESTPPPPVPLTEPLPYTVIAVDNTGVAHLFDLTTRLATERSLATGVLAGEPITDVTGGATGPLVVRASLLRYHLIDLDNPAPIPIGEGTIAALDEVAGWSWFGGCRTPPCPRVTTLLGFGPTSDDRREIDLPPPTDHVVATAGLLYADAAGSIIRIDPATGDRRVVAAGSLLDAQGSTVVVRSCATDLTCPVVVLDVDHGQDPIPIALDGDDIKLSPNGEFLVSGARAPALAPTLRVVEVATGRSVDVDPSALRFVTVPFRWTPDGRWLIGATGSRNLVAIHLADGSVSRFEFPGLDRAIAGLIVRMRQ